MKIIEACHLTKKFGELTAVEDLSLTVEQGEVLGFLGPNGAGKTTTIRMLSGIISPTSGYAWIGDYRTDGEIEHLHESIGLLTETPGFYEKLSARRNLEFFAGFYPNIEIKARVEKYLKTMGLWERRQSRVGTFSKGMKQRLALARALLHEPKVLFLDEPTAGLDPEAAREVRELVKKLSSEGRTIFLSTHNLTEAEQLCHRIAVIRTKLLAVDSGQNLRHRFFRREAVIRLDNPGGTVVEAVKKLAFVEDLREEADRLVLVLSEPDKNRPELVNAIVGAGGRILEVSEREHPLEEIYLKLMREEK
ncbi:MAG: ABC transporter ATP-binding protein [Dehalococcoidales bacterium]|nr:ABC transporter ATP-binding protein [Dehalococcoidales bacterium]